MFFLNIPLSLSESTGGCQTVEADEARFLSHVKLPLVVSNVHPHKLSLKLQSKSVPMICKKKGCINLCKLKTCHVPITLSIDIECDACNNAYFNIELKLLDSI
jgi:hypothetical protein